jgi:hypothetical protein
MRGFAKATHFNEENSGLPFSPFQIKENGPGETVRVLALPAFDPERPDYPVIQSIVMHRAWKVLNPTRCASTYFNEEEGITEQTTEPGPSMCPLCAVKAPRTLRTYIPVLRRKRPDETGYQPKVQVVEYGREGVNVVIAQMEELPGNDLTTIDFKIKRQGKGKDTKYPWIAVQGTHRPLNEMELAMLVDVPDIDALLPCKTPVEMQRRADDYVKATEKVLAIDEGRPTAAADDLDDDEIPF